MHLSSCHYLLKLQTIQVINCFMLVYSKCHSIWPISKNHHKKFISAAILLCQGSSCQSIEFKSASAETCREHWQTEQWIICQDILVAHSVHVHKLQKCPIALADVNALAFRKTVVRAFELATIITFAKCRCALSESFVNNQGSSDTLQPSAQCPL